jgi:hypothetical protein
LDVEAYSLQSLKIQIIIKKVLVLQALFYLQTFSVTIRLFGSLKAKPCCDGENTELEKRLT